MHQPNHIIIPESLDPRSAINCAKYICKLEKYEGYFYDFKNMRHCPPFGMLILSNAIRKNIGKYPKASHYPIGYKKNKDALYMADIGFFQSIGNDEWNIGRQTSQEDYGTRHIPIKKFILKELIDQYGQDFPEIGEVVDRASVELAHILIQDTESEIYKTLKYCIREIVRNTYEHAQTKEIWICGVYWPNRRRAEIAILDEGCGIRESLYRKYPTKSDKDAIELAIKPGISGANTSNRNSYDFWENSGYGLYVSSEICCHYGNFIIASGDSELFINETKREFYDCNIKGTAICLALRTEEIMDIEDMLKDITTKGEQESGKYNKGERISASKSSTTI